MVTFKQFLKEELTKFKVFHDIQPSVLMNLAKEHGSTRFLIDGADRIHAANAHRYIHTQLYDGEMNTDGKSKITQPEKLRGTISHDPMEDKTYYAINNNVISNKDGINITHPILDSLEKKGAIRGHRVGDWSRVVVKANKVPKEKKINFGSLLDGIMKNGNLSL